MEELIRAHFKNMHNLRELAIKTVFETGLIHKKQILVSGLTGAREREKELDALAIEIREALRNEN